MGTLFNPMQPEWNQKLAQLQTTIPSSLFNTSIAYAYQFKLESTLEDTLVLPGIPDGCLDIIFNLDEDKSDCYLIPSPKARHEYYLKTNTTYFGIRMLPLQTIFLFDGALKEINNYSQLPLFDVAPILYQIYNQLLEPSTIEERLTALEHFFTQNTIPLLSHSTTLESCIQYSIRSKGNIHVKDLETHTGYSERYLRKLFQNEIGISPKNFLEIIYFQHTLHEMVTGSFQLEQHLLENDFYDTSHFYKKFKKITHMTPIEYRKLITVGSS